MPDKQITHYIKNENNTDILYLVAVTCIQRLMKLEKPAVVKAIVDSGTTSLYKMTNK